MSTTSKQLQVGASRAGTGRNYRGGRRGSAAAKTEVSIDSWREQEHDEELVEQGAGGAGRCNDDAGTAKEKEQRKKTKEELSYL